LGIAALFGILAMGLAGYLWPYISVYLSEMFGHHIPQESSPMLSVFNWQRLWYDIRDFSPGFAYFLLLMLLHSFYCRSKEWNNMLQPLWDVFLLLIAVCLTSLSVGIGGAYFNHHFIFAVPFYCAIFLRFTLDIFEYRKGATVAVVAAGCSVLLLSSAMFSHVTMNYERLLANFEREPKPAMEIAKVVDGVLDACAIDRYLFLGGNGPQPFGYTKHSPLGPLFFQYYYSLSPDRTFFREKFMETIYTAQVVVVQSYRLHDLREKVVSYLTENFSETPWACAKGHVVGRKVSDYKLLYRKAAK
jgi:hypothetical protein